MDFNRNHLADHSLVERAVLRALGVDRLTFRPTAPRERVVPEREAIQARMLIQKKQRLGNLLTGRTRRCPWAFAASRYGAGSAASDSRRALWAFISFHAWGRLCGASQCSRVAS